MSKAHRLIPRKDGSSPQSRGARNRSAMAKQTEKGLTLPVNFLLGCSLIDLDNFVLARMAAVADLRAQLHELFDRLSDTSAQIIVAQWFRSIDREALKRLIENQESPLEWAKRMIAQGQRSEEELIPLPSLPPGAAHLAAALRYQERNIAEGKCSVCPEPLDPNSVRYCTKHLTAARTKSARQRGVKGEPGSLDYLYGEITESTHGRQPGTLRSLEMNREQKTRAVLAELGLKPESAAVGLNAAKDALLRVMPDSKTRAMTAYDLFQAAQIPTSIGRRSTTGYRALRELLSAGKIRRVGKARSCHPFRYFVGCEDAKSQ